MLDPWENYGLDAAGVTNAASSLHGQASLATSAVANLDQYTSNLIAADVINAASIHGQASLATSVITNSDQYTSNLVAAGVINAASIYGQASLATRAITNSDQYTSPLVEAGVINAASICGHTSLTTSVITNANHYASNLIAAGVIRAPSIPGQGSLSTSVFTNANQYERNLIAAGAISSTSIYSQAQIVSDAIIEAMQLAGGPIVDGAIIPSTIQASAYSPSATTVTAALSLISGSQDFYREVALAEVLAKLAAPTTSQRQFWDLHDTLRGYATGRFILTRADQDHIDFGVDSQLRLAAFGLDAPLTSRERARILGMVRSAALTQWARSDLSFSQLFELFKKEVTKVAVLRQRLARFIAIPSAPSTHAWVHEYLLWTGISPPVLLMNAERTLISKENTGESNVSHIRSSARTDSRSAFNRRTSKRDSAHHLQSGAPVACGSRSRRPLIFRGRRAPTRRTLDGPSYREMGDQFRVRARSWT